MAEWKIGAGWAYLPLLLDLDVTILFGLFQDLELADEGELFEFSLDGVDDADDG